MTITINDTEYETFFDRSEDYRYIIVDDKRKYYKFCNGCGKPQLYGLKLDMIRQIQKNSKCMMCRDYRGDHNPMFGKHHTEELKEEISKLNSGRKRTEKQKLEQSIRMTGEKHPLFGKHHSEESKQKIGMKNRLLQNKKRCYSYPRFNPIACKYFDELNKQNGWNLQHAMNGGEYYIKELGYWVDAYDKERNIIVEYDEPPHYTKRGQLKQKDVKRMLKIKEFLKCDFYRYNEKNKSLVK